MGRNIISFSPRRAQGELKRKRKASEREALRKKAQAHVEAELSARCGAKIDAGKTREVRVSFPLYEMASSGGGFLLSISSGIPTARRRGYPASCRFLQYFQVAVMPTEGRQFTVFRLVKTFGMQTPIAEILRITKVETAGP